MLRHASLPQMTAGKRFVSNQRHWDFFSRSTLFGLGCASVLTSAAAFTVLCNEATCEELAGSAPTVDIDTDVDLMNWSGTHSIRCKKVFQPDTIEELEELVAWAHRNGQKLRPCGNLLSPNGIALSKEGMINLSSLDKIVQVDAEAKTITVQAGARVSQVLDALRPYGLTLENFSSVQEQQIGGWTQVAAHGTGASLPTVDEMITEMTVVTPALGRIRVSAGENASLFPWLRVGLGSLGIVAEVTMKCTESHDLRLRRYVVTREEVRSKHAELLQQYRHVRYMWFPYADKVNIDVSNPVPVARRGDPDVLTPTQDAAVFHNAATPLRELLTAKTNITPAEVQNLSIASLRDKLVAIAPLSLEHIQQVNTAEAETWARTEGMVQKDSTDILGFECGGQQWVHEVCFECGTQTNPNLADIDYMLELLARIEEKGIVAPCPIEQRWTARSSAFMSPAHSENPDAIFSWVGVIMYLTAPDGVSDMEEALSRARVGEAFEQYTELHQELTTEYGGAHWAKVEVPERGKRDAYRAGLIKHLRCRYPTAEFERVRQRLDPRNILANSTIEAIFIDQEI